MPNTPPRSPSAAAAAGTAKMNAAILIFDQLNDVVYMQCTDQFLAHVKARAQWQGLSVDDLSWEDGRNLVMQVFAPLVTSQRFMAAQFGNRYAAVQCKDKTNLVFQEFMGYLFVGIGTQPQDALRRVLTVCVQLVQKLCGPNVSLLKTSEDVNELLSLLMERWEVLRQTDQAFLMEAVEQLLVNPDLTAATMRALKECIDVLVPSTGAKFHSAHALLLVDSKLLGLYSSKGAKELRPADLLFLLLLALTLCQPQDLDLEHCQRVDLQSQVVVLQPEEDCFCPHVAYVGVVQEGMTLVTVCEAGGPGGAAAAKVLSEAIHSCCQWAGSLHHTRNPLRERSITLDRLEAALKRLGELHHSLPRVASRWEATRRLLRSTPADGAGGSYGGGQEGLCNRLEASLGGLLEALKEAFGKLCMREGERAGAEGAGAALQAVRAKTSDIAAFLRVKALRNLTLGAYLEEFPGLVHFIYLDRHRNQLTLPSLDFSSPDTLALTKRKIWSMVDFSAQQVRRGHFGFIWKDGTFSYSYFLWFENAAGVPLRIKGSAASVKEKLKGLPLLGVMGGDFYPRLTEALFPALDQRGSGGKVRCYELYCIHLGLATTSCVLEHSRRLAATLWDLIGVPNSPADLL